MFYCFTQFYLFVNFYFSYVELSNCPFSVWKLNDSKDIFLFYAIIMNIKVLLHCICICSGAGTRVTNYVPSKPFSMIFHHVVTMWLQNELGWQNMQAEHQIWHESDKAHQGEKKYSNTCLE